MTIATGQPLLASDINDLTFFPKGAILTFSSDAWGATSTKFKTIWKVCDGTNGTPNLVNKFLRGSSSSGDTGGADSCPVSIAAANLPAHSHGVTSLPVSDLSINGLSIASGGGGHSHTVSGNAVANSGAHTHTGSGTTNTGSGGHKHSDISGSTGNPSKSLTGSFGQDDYCADVYTAGGMLSTTAWGYDAVSNRSGEGFKISIDATHTHSFTSATTGDNSGTHSHDVNVSIPEGGSHSHTISGSTSEGGGTHSHTIAGTISGGSVSGTTDSTGSGTAFNVATLPAYYTVIYIIKVV
jgi:hypothetical protein